MAVSRFRAILSGPPETRAVGLQKHQASSIYSDMAEKYGGLKKELAKCYGQDIEAYVNGKTAFIEQVLLEIEKECENPEVALQSPAAPAFPLILRDDYPWQTRRGAVQLLTN